jgi:hypothetical protein
MRFTTLLFGALLVKHGFAWTPTDLVSRAEEPCTQVSVMVAPMMAANPTSTSKIILHLYRIDKFFLFSYFNNTWRTGLSMSAVRSPAFRRGVECNGCFAPIYPIPIR